MRKVIDWKLYDTKVSTLICRATNHSYWGDYWNERLYKTKNGVYFIAWEWGALTEYCISLGSGTLDGSSSIWVQHSIWEIMEWFEKVSCFIIEDWEENFFREFWDKIKEA